MARPSSESNASRLATSITLIPDAAICRANSLPIPDEAPVTSAHGPNRSLSIIAVIVLLLSQGPDPVLKPLCFRHHDLWVFGADRNSRHTLKGREEMDREFS